MCVCGKQVASILMMRFVAGWRQDDFYMVHACNLRIHPIFNLKGSMQLTHLYSSFVCSNQMHKHALALGLVSGCIEAFSTWPCV